MYACISVKNKCYLSCRNGLCWSKNCKEKGKLKNGICIYFRVKLLKFKGYLNSRLSYIYISIMIQHDTCNESHSLKWCIKINLLTSASFLGVSELAGQESGSKCDSFLSRWCTISVMAVDKHILIVYAFPTARKPIMATT